MNINIIVSASENWVIGKDNKLLWKLNDDLKRFKNLTTNKIVIMGQKTFESLPNGALPNRKNIVLTDNKDFNAPNIIKAYNIPEALEMANSNEIFIIGGGSIYKQFLKYASKIHLTVVHTVIDGDTFFPEIDTTKWNLISEEPHNKDKKNEYNVTYKIYNRNES